MRYLKTFAASATIAASLIAVAPSAGADTIDDALAKIPSGEISCAQASAYWTNEADYNNKVAQARTLAMFDSRGPQILSALARVEEAANRCGLKGGGTATTNTTTATADTATAYVPQANNSVATTANAATSFGFQGLGQNISVPLPAGTPTVAVPVPGVGSFTIPDLASIVANFFNQVFGQVNAGSSR